MQVPETLQEALERYEPVIGLEVHAQLLTRSKVFSSASAAFAPDAPNSHVTAYCIGLPGVLPVLNEQAVRMAIRAGLALGCEIRARSIWARKHYFYPDLPKGYQISQYSEPVCEHGKLGNVRVVRIHMEEDAGKNTHVEGAHYTLVDYNRAGVPLIEIVSGPDIRSAAEAGSYLRSLRSILMALEVCDGNMEEGSFRCDANVSIRPRGQTKLGTRCEIKNVNSFKFVEQAIEHEILRHAKILAAGGTVEQETRLFDSQKKLTRSMRSKEEAHDYRYFPDPDLPPLVIPAEWIEEARRSLPELPEAKVARFVAMGLPEENARTFADEPDVAAFFDAAVAARPARAVAIANLIKGEVLRELKDSPLGMKAAKISAADLAELVELKESDRISSSSQKKMFLRMWHDGAPLASLAAEAGEQVSDESVLAPIVAEIVAANPREAAEYRAGKVKVIGFFVGLVMKATGGKAKPQVIKELAIKEIEETGAP